MAFKYSTALVIQPSREVFENDYEKAKAEHDRFVDALRQLEVNILEYGPEERRPNAHKVGDIAVIINGTALMCRPFGSDRQSEVSVVRQTLKKEMGLTIAELNNEQAQLEGSDVLFTGNSCQSCINSASFSFFCLVNSSDDVVSCIQVRK